MAALTVQNIALDSIEPTYAAADVAGDEFLNNGRTFLHIKNASGSPIVATVTSEGDCSQGFNHPVVITIAAGEEEMCGPFGIARFNDGDSLVNVAYDGVTTLTVAAFALGT